MNKSKIKQQLQSESGQSVILISMVILSFLMFFSFAINTGILITAKISVQSAADAAAYAGAAAQARQLNAISYLNYDMRRQYKKFLYRYAFMANVSSSNFPNNPTGAGPGHYGYPKERYINENTHNSVAIKVPVVCIPLTGSATQNDSCVFLNFASTVAQTEAFFPQGGLTMTTQAFLQNAAQIQAFQEDQCSKSGGVNLFTTTSWLFRGNLDESKLKATLSSLTNKLTDDQSTKVTNIVSNMSAGLGLYPRNIINYMRIKTLEGFLNDPQKKLMKDDADSLASSNKAESSERSLQAFNSALSNLNADVINHSSVTMQELQNSNQINLNLIDPSFNVYVQFLLPPDPSNSGSNSTICNSAIIPFQARHVPVGVFKASSTPVHYAVKINAKAKLLFLPSGTPEIELEAFASAKPFGSRIGPQNTIEDFREKIKPATLASSEINDCQDPDTGCYSPNLNISGAETFYSPGYLQILSGLGVSTVNNSKVYTFKGLENALAPQQNEVGHYNIIPPPQDAESMNFEFIPYAKDENSQIYRFYAPIDGAGGDVKTEISKMMASIFGTTAVPGNNPFKIDMTALRASLEQNIGNYIDNDLPAGGAMAEHGETLTFAAIELPMAQTNPPLPKNPTYWLTAANEVRSSWGPPFARLNSSTNGFKPRFGYSVKFVAMQDLIKSGMNASDDDQEKVSH